VDKKQKQIFSGTQKSPAKIFAGVSAKNPAFIRLRRIRREPCFLASKPPLKIVFASLQHKPIS